MYDETGSGARYRHILGGWSNQSLRGRPLLISALNGRLTRTAAYRQTICDISELAYLLARLNDDRLPEIESAITARDNLITALIGLIQRLTWQDFELFVDLIFTFSGWRRTGVLGGTQKTVDIDWSYRRQRSAPSYKSNQKQIKVDLRSTSRTSRLELKGACFMLFTAIAPPLPHPTCASPCWGQNGLLQWR